MKEDWKEQLKRKLDGHEIPPPEGLWEGISEQMGLDAEPSSTRPVISRCWWAAAAAVLALVGFFAFYNMNNSERHLQVNNMVESNHGDRSLIQVAPQNQATSTLDSSEQPKKRKDIITSLSEEVAQTAPFMEDKQITETDQHDEPVEQENKRVEEQGEDQKDRSLIQPVPQNQATSPFDFPDSPKVPTPKKKWSVGVNASGGLLAANTSQRVDRVYYKNEYYDVSDGFHYVETAAPSQAYSLTEYESKHNLPLRFGLSLQYQLNDRLALLSGISYTYLYSEFSIPLYQSVNYDQKLHYLGLPFGVSWRLLTANRFRIYLAGGVMLEKCLNEKPWQWSVNGAAGAEYAIASQLGVYLEPSLGYYFSDGTQFEHYYKEHPLAPSIEFGLRLHVGK